MLKMKLLLLFITVLVFSVCYGYEMDDSASDEDNLVDVQDEEMNVKDLSEQEKEMLSTLSEDDWKEIEDHEGEGSQDENMAADAQPGWGRRRRRRRSSRRRWLRKVGRFIKKHKRVIVHHAKKFHQNCCQSGKCPKWMCGKKRRDEMQDQYDEELEDDKK